MTYPDGQSTVWERFQRQIRDVIICRILSVVCDYFSKASRCIFFFRLIFIDGRAGTFGLEHMHETTKPWRLQKHFNNNSTVSIDIGKITISNYISSYLRISIFITRKRYESGSYAEPGIKFRNNYFLC